MRRLVLLCLLIIFGCCCGGCGSLRAPTAPVTEFTADFTADYRGMPLGGTVTVGGRGSAGILLSSPESLKGMRALYRNGEFKLTLGALGCTADEAYLPDGAFFTEMKSLLTGVSDADANGCAALPCGACRYTFDENGLLLAAETEDLCVTFSGCAAGDTR